MYCFPSVAFTKLHWRPGTRMLGVEPVFGVSGGLALLWSAHESNKTAFGRRVSFTFTLNGKHERMPGLLVAVVKRMPSGPQKSLVNTAPKLDETMVPAGATSLRTATCAVGPVEPSVINVF